ncbi:hypothetical protein GNY06_05715 [Elizabethkingia argentiflava]|uniref:Uncharacterized protein n=1 Tax=Elizabethkingia argenteiflava TaxID=2681556 RepID=A0A845PXU4_9FLAO|nr:hypothetical protein [Elizabethkingia argenteiflava]NAW50890.1 hypothetical protein [Elizabethkingia argenteiflava]
MKSLLFLIIPFFLCAQNNLPPHIMDSGFIDQKKEKEPISRYKSDSKALDLLKKVNKNFKKNTPKNQNSYRFKAYSKFFVDFDQDSIQAYQAYIKSMSDSLSLLPSMSSSSTRKKSWRFGDFGYKKTLTQSKIFLWERVLEYKFSKRYGENVDILDNRISGLKQPIYDAMVLQSNIEQIPDEIKKENWILYRYFLIDSIQYQGRDTYVIGFRKKSTPPSHEGPYNGYLYIDQKSYAVAKIENKNNDKGDIENISIWQPIHNSWFLERKYMKVRVGSIGFGKVKKKKKKFGKYLYMENVYFDFEIPSDDLSRKDFKGYNYHVKNTSGSQLYLYRRGNFDTRDAATYCKMDSLAKTKKVEFTLNFLAGIPRGDFRLGPVNLPLDKFFDINRYENLRLGMGVKFNEDLSAYISPDAYIAYGVRDGRWKHRIGIDVRTTLKKDDFFRLEYTDDIAASGKFNQNLWVGKMKIMNAGAGIQNLNYYRYYGFKLSYLNSPINSLTYRVETANYKEYALFDYAYKGIGKTFNNLFSMLSLKYSPNSKYIMTPSGKDMVEQGYPEMYFNWEKGWADFKYYRFDVLALYQLKSLWGQTGLRLYGGYVKGSFPVWKSFESGGLAPEGKNSFMSRFNLTTYLGFATMPSGVYYQDKFGAFYLSHRLPWHFKSFGQNTSSFDMVYKGMIGEFKNPDFHAIKFESLKKLYQEVGIEWNNFLSSQFNLGVFYRVGPYNTPHFKDNFAVQLKLKILGF